MKVASKQNSKKIFLLDITLYMSLQTWNASELIHGSRLEMDFISAMKQHSPPSQSLQEAASREVEWT